MANMAKVMKTDESPTPMHSRMEGVSVYGDHHFSETVGQILQTFRQQNILCDARINVEDTEFPVHRCIMAASSPYFKSMFSEHFVENKERVVVLTATKTDGFRELLRFAYTGLVELCEENVINVFCAAHQYSYPALVKICTRYFLSSIKPNNCLCYLKVAEMYELQSVLEEAHKLILKNFIEVSKTPEFKELSYEALGRFLTKDNLKSTSEFAIFGAVCSWIEYDKERAQNAFNLMKHIRFSLMQTNELTEEVRRSPIMTSDDACMDLLFDALAYSRDWLAQPLSSPYHAKPRSPEKLIIIGGEMFGTELVKNWNGKVFEKLESLPVPVHHACGVKCGNFLFVLGGSSSAERWDQAVDSLFRYDAVKNKWQQMARMSNKRVLHASVLVSDQLMAIAGRNVECLSSVEVYSIRTDTWQRLPEFPTASVGLAGCTCNGVVYASGGAFMRGTSWKISKNMMSYNYDAKTWNVLHPMPEWRKGHSMIGSTCGNHIYVVGGFSKLQQYAREPLQYNPIVNQWIRLLNCPMVFGQSYTGCVAFGDSIFMAGDLGSQQGTHDTHVQVFDTKKKCWIKLSRLPVGLTGTYICTTLRCPKNSLESGDFRHYELVPL